jgi:hypothetical protein
MVSPSASLYLWSMSDKKKDKKRKSDSSERLDQLEKRVAALEDEVQKNRDPNIKTTGAETPKIAKS